MRSSQEQLTAKLQQSQTQLDHAKAQCDQAKTRALQLQSHLDQAKAQLDKTKAELDHTRSQASHLQTQLNQSQAELLQSRTQLEQIGMLYNQARTHNSHLHSQLEQLSAQLNQARVPAAQLQAQLHTSEKSTDTSDETLLIKESEVTRLQARISSLERAADRQHLTHTLSLPALHKHTHSPEYPSPHSPKHHQTTIHSHAHSHTIRSHSPTHVHSSPTAHTHLEPALVPYLSNQTEPHQTSEWLQTSSGDSSLNLPLSVKATLREALSQHPWESSSPSFSLYPHTVDHSWQGLSATEATATSDLSFNPLTYMMDKRNGPKGEGDEERNPNMKATLMQEGSEEWANNLRRESVDTLVGHEEEEGPLTGMLRFVNQTLAMQEDPSLWSCMGPSQTGHNHESHKPTPV